ncbi:cytosine permease [Burkholderia ubonensis]|uniref:cytosine permease n=1 Tax=Burkholderia ubonensis TaxID=101571 RepID=UPI000756D202|nr:cytosine permease [Burkholderia ubonensis]AOI68549.1 hypothetical protein WI31_03030 [Burkholderia ubonensis]KUZ23098.1 hypothetical protein WI29_12950 [Burkholderia ubonensis]KUZ25798.1 hypothetical protein WI32_32600 [Burkholderia ubonensis]KUZ31748.1 hypothetical protein WI30_18055 [Burkholderia ubonensis]KUZ51004.1 hypothetical protein WI34_30940 [Burkholderia ubonensis]
MKSFSTTDKFQPCADSRPSEKPNIWEKTQDFALEPVPAGSRRSWLSMTVIMVAIGFDVGAFLIGIALANGLSLVKAILAALSGSTLLGLLAISCAVVGSRTGFSAARVAWFSFGHYGARLIALLSGLSLLGWFGVQDGFLGNNLADIFATLGFHVPGPLFSVCGGILMTSTAIYGYRSMETLSKWSVPALMLTMGLAIAVLFARGGLSEHAPPHPIRFTVAMGYVLSGFLASVSSFPDISRYARSTKDAALGAFFGFFLGNSLMLVIAIVLSKYTGESNLVKLFASLHMTLCAVIVLTLAQWVTNTSNIYSISLAFSNVAPEAGIPKAVYAIGAGAVGTTLAVAGIADHFLNFLVMMSIVVAPIGGAYSGYYFLCLRGRLPERAPALVPRSLLAWISGAILGWLTMRFDPLNGLYGLGVFSLTTVPPVDGFLLAFAIGGFPLRGIRRGKAPENRCGLTRTGSPARCRRE